MEYRGETVRRGLADRREAAYRAAGKDCYLFALGDETVIDATLAGTIARFTVRVAVCWLGFVKGNCVTAHQCTRLARQSLSSCWLALYLPASAAWVGACAARVLRTLPGLLY